MNLLIFGIFGKQNPSKGAEEGTPHSPQDTDVPRCHHRCPSSSVGHVSPQIFVGSSSPQTQQCHLTPGLTAGDKDLGGTGIAVDVGGSAAVIPVIPGPCIPNFQPQGISGGGDTEPLAWGHLGPASGHHGAIAVDGQGGRRVAVHRAEDNDQPATLGLLEEREGGNSGRICGMGEEDEVGMSLEWLQGKIPE